MTGETKVGLLVGLGVISLVGIILTDHLAIQSSDDISPLLEIVPSIQETVVPPPIGPETFDITDGILDPSAAPQIALGAAPFDKPPAPQPTWAVDRNAYGRQIAPLVTIQTQPQADAGTPIQTIDDFRSPRQPTPEPTEHKVYYVKPGDSLYIIAERIYGDGSFWPLIRKANPKSVRKNGHVRDGVRLIIPARPGQQQSAVAATPPTVTQKIKEPLAVAPQKTIIVQPGDTLTGLAQTHLGSSRQWTKLMAANRKVLSSPRTLQPGMKLRVPVGATIAATTTPTRPLAPMAVQADAGARFYTVKAGDSLWRIAQSHLKNGNRYPEIIKANRNQLANVNNMTPGQKLRLPPL